MTVAPADNTYAQIEKKIRRLTASSGGSSLTSADIQQHVNTFYSSDFPYGIKLDQMRSVYTFYTRPYIDRYPLDVNYSQGVREPVYVEGIQGYFFKDRTDFYRMWPRWPTKHNPISGDGVTTAFSFTVQGPFLSKEVVLGGVDVGGGAISVADDGNGNMQMKIPNSVVSVPAQTLTPPVPGMYNTNTGNPGLETVINIGTVDYVTGAIAVDFSLGGVIPASGQVMTLWVSNYQPGRPYSLLFWNNEFTIRPIPRLTHKIEVEIYLTPVQFMQTTDHPILNQWVQYIAYGAAMELLRERNDFAGVEGLREGFMRQEALVLERQGVEEIGQRNSTIFSATVQGLGWNSGFMQGWM